MSNDHSQDAVIFVGPIKTTTTLLHLYLSQRSDLRMARRLKEVFFYDRFYDRGSAWYLNQFSSLVDAGDQILPLVDVAPSLFHQREAPDRLKRMFPQAKIVITLRNPAKRAVSHYYHMLRYGETRDSLQEVFQEDVRSIHTISRYERFVPEWISKFGNENVLVLIVEEMLADTESAEQELCSFMGIPPDGELTNCSQIRENEGSAPRSFLLSRTVRVTADLLRKWKMESLVAALRMKWLKNLVWGRSFSADDRSVQRKQAEDLLPVFEETVAFVESLLGRRIPSWHVAEKLTAPSGVAESGVHGAQLGR